MQKQIRLGCVTIHPTRQPLKTMAFSDSHDSVSVETGVLGLQALCAQHSFPAPYLQLESSSLNIPYSMASVRMHAEESGDISIYTFTVYSVVLVAVTGRIRNYSLVILISQSCTMSIELAY